MSHAELRMHLVQFLHDHFDSYIEYFDILRIAV